MNENKDRKKHGSAGRNRFMKPITIGLLPLYIALYDESNPELRPRLEAFYEEIARGLENRGLSVLRTPFCRRREEFEQAVAGYEAGGAAGIVTLHMAYSPSLESEEILSATPLPLVVLDTTETWEFGPEQDPGEIMYCHGIHGVMDLCSMLRQRGKPFAIAAGHWRESDVLDRTAGLVRAAAGAASLFGSRVGTIGGSFEGMGDFRVSADELLSRFGVTVVKAEETELCALRDRIAERDIREDMEADLARGERLALFSPAVHGRTVQSCLTVRRWLEAQRLDAFTVNFRAVRPEMGLSVMPFMEACKAMERGIGYAGEGDVLTAAFTGALMRGFGAAAFVEIFCPDWKDGRLFLSHMGEIHYGLLSGKPELKELPFVFGEAENPIVGYGCYRAGKAIFVNIFRDKQGFRLLAAPVAMEEPAGEDRFAGNVRGWMKPAVPLDAFLEQLSTAGATHHSVLVYDASVDQMKFFAALLGLPITVVE